MNINELYLKTAFCCMACDGDIADGEVALLGKVAKQTDLFGDLDVQTLVNGYVAAINKEGFAFLSSYLKEVADSQLTDEQALSLITLAINTIEADSNIEYSEISFFKKIRKYLSISDDEILAVLPDKEDYLLPDIDVNDNTNWTVAFSNIEIL